MSHKNFIQLSLHDRTKHKCKLLTFKAQNGSWTQKYLYRLSADHRDSIPYKRKPDSFLFWKTRVGFYLENGVYVVYAFKSHISTNVPRISLLYHY